MSDLQQQLDQEIQQHNDLHAQIQAGKEQLTGLEIELNRRFGRITVLQELVQREQGPSEEVPEVEPEPEANGSE